ncbi:MAG: O-antigen ligase family protein, partial [Granulosicoccaceae bacterium]
LIVVSANSQTLYKRFVVGAYLKADITFNLNDIPRDKDVFFGRRLYLSVFGVEQWLDKPLLGHGATGVDALLDADPDFHIHHHLHNTYVQTLAEIGLLGALAWAMISAVILLGVYKHGSRLGSPALVNFFWTALALAVWSLQSAPVHVAYWRFAVIMVCALGLSIILQSQHQRSDHTNKYSA